MGQLGIQCARTMNEEWQVVEGTGWIAMPRFGRINPDVTTWRAEASTSRRTWTTASTQRHQGRKPPKGPETCHFEFGQPFLMADSIRQHCVEATI